MAGVPDFEGDPTPVEQGKWVAPSACWFWSSKGLDRRADLATPAGVLPRQPRPQDLRPW